MMFQSAVHMTGAIRARAEGMRPPWGMEPDS